MSQVVDIVCTILKFILYSEDILLKALVYARVWHHVDASDRILDKFMMGKHKTPSMTLVVRYHVDLFIVNLTLSLAIQWTTVTT